MTNSQIQNHPIDLILKWGALLACVLLGAIALYSSGVGLIDPKVHRAGGFALALLVGVYAARAKRSANGPATGPSQILQSAVDFAMIAAGLWAIWSFFFVQTEMEEALYDVSSADAWPAVAGLIVFLELVITHPLNMGPDGCADAIYGDLFATRAN